MKLRKRFVVVVLGLVLVLMFGAANAFADTSIVDTTDARYSYSDLTEDAKALAEKYSDRCSLTSIGTSYDGRKLWCLKIGSDQASNQVVVLACVHAREYINAPVAMAMAEEYCKNYTSKKIKGKTYKEILTHTQVYIVPMVNPDGVMLAQEGIDAIKDEELKKTIQSCNVSGGYYNWKANARGVDLNRNYKVGWNQTTNKNTSPSSEFYGGSEPYSEKETKAIMKMFEGLNCQAVINLHTEGQVYYWGYTDKTETNEKRLVNIVQDETGYSGVQESGNGDGDMEHYFKNTLKIPYVCIENAYGGFPNDHSLFSSIYEKNVNIPLRAANAFRGKIIEKTDTSEESSTSSATEAVEKAVQKVTSTLSLSHLALWVLGIILLAMVLSFIIWKKLINVSDKHGKSVGRGATARENGKRYALRIGPIRIPLRRKK